VARLSAGSANHFLTDTSQMNRGLSD
jgi:hypothetical protein